jgi:GR25 family glycosyltransferase involved in LPS biosynthesis
MVTVCEDDVIFHQIFVRSSAELLKSLPRNWDIVLWGWNFDSVLVFDLIPGLAPFVAQPIDQKGLLSRAKLFQHSKLAWRLYRLHRAFGLACYTISPSGARHLRDRCFPLRDQIIDFPELGFKRHNRGIDFLTAVAYPGLAAFVCFPPLVVSPNEKHQSTVQQSGL